MSFWQRLFGFGSAPTDPPNQAAPFSWQEDLDGGKLRVSVTRHALGLAGQSFPCWTYATSGLAAAGQREMVLTLVCEKGETAFPRDPLPLFVQFLRLAEQGRTVEEGDYTCFRAPGGFLGTTEQTGLIYLRAERLPDVDLPEHALAAVLLTPDEAELIPVIGSYRVMSLLGKKERFYPCPPWSERGRASVLTRESMEGSVLRKLPLAVYPGATASVELAPQAPPLGMEDRITKVQGRLTFRLPLPQPDGFRDTLAHLADEWSLAFLLKPDPLADVRLVYSPGSEGETITSAGSAARAMTGGFLILAAGSTVPTGARIAEDGFAVLLGPKAREEARKALLGAGPLLIQGEEGMLDFGIEWVSAPPAMPARAKAFDVQRTVLYQPDEVLRARVPSVEAFSGYLRQVLDLSDAYWQGIEKDQSRPVLVVVALKTGGRSRFWIESEIPLEPVLLAPWLEKLESLKVPAVTGPVAVALEGALWGNPSVKGGWAFMPTEWQEACAGCSLLIPDEVLDVVWPG